MNNINYYFLFIKLNKLIFQLRFSSEVIGFNVLILKVPLLLLSVHKLPNVILLDCDKKINY